MIRVLVSNTAIPTKKIGSWTNRISRLIEADQDFFTYIFSPDNSNNSKNVRCIKRKRIPFFPKRFNKWHLLNYQLKSYVDAYRDLPYGEQKLQIVVMDDLLLLEVFALLKAGGGKFELVFSFHGHSLALSGHWGGYVDQILFLTNSGYLETLLNHHEFTPRVSIVGNGVSSLDFYPLTKLQKEKRKVEKGISPNSKILVWLSNNRPKKGFHIFKRVASNLINRYSDLHIWIIGIEGDEDLLHDRISYFGKIQNDELPGYLQMSDFYMFTSLWKEGFGLTLVEAAKCGNQVIASRIGGIPEVVSGIEGVQLIDYPNRPEFWENAFSIAWAKSENFIPDPQILRNFHDLDTWMTKFKKALTS